MPERSPAVQRIMIEVGNRIRDARRSRRMTQAQVADAAGNPNLARRLTKYENGEDHMSMVAFFDICKGLQMMPTDLAPLDLLPEGASVIEEFLQLTIEQQNAVRLIIRTLKNANVTGA